MTLPTVCKCCGSTTDLDYTFGAPARTYGPPEQCDSGSPDEIDPEECPECGAKFDLGAIATAAEAKVKDLELENALRESEHEERRPTHR